MVVPPFTIRVCRSDTKDRGQCADRSLRIAVGAHAAQERTVKPGKIISPDDPAIGPHDDALLMEVLKVATNSVSGYVQSLNEHADGGVAMLLERTRPSQHVVAPGAAKLSRPLRI